MSVGELDSRDSQHPRQWRLRVGGGDEYARRELIATNEPTVMAKPPLDPTVMENG